MMTPIAPILTATLRRHRHRIGRRQDPPEFGPEFLQLCSEGGIGKAVDKKVDGWVDCH